MTLTSPSTYAPAPVADLPAAILAIDRLNSFVRTSDEHLYPGLMHHVYAMKASAIATANEQGLAVRRRVFVRVKCSRCGGSGVWVGRYEELPCRACEAAGLKRLDFTETTIGRTLHTACDWPADWQELRWHSPRCQADDGAEEVTDWKPRTPGRPMTPIEVVEALNLAEPVWPSPLYAAGTYGLYLGKTEGVCVFCSGVTREGDGTYAFRGRLRWRGDVCDGCRKHWQPTAWRYGGYRNLFGARMQIHADVDHPAVAAWIDRHGGARKVKTTQDFGEGYPWA